MTKDTAYKLTAQFSRNSLAALVFLVLFSIQFLLIPRAAFAQARASTPEAALSDMIHRWFGPYLATTTKATAQKKPRWVTDMQDTYIAGHLSATAQPKPPDFSPNTSAWERFGINTFGAPGESSTKGIPHLASWWQKILQLFRPLWSWF